MRVGWESNLPLLRYHAAMPRPLNARQALEQEWAELLRHIAAYRQELENSPKISKARRERLEWQIRRNQKRMAEIEGRLAGS